DGYVIAYDENLDQVFWTDRIDAGGLDDTPVDISAFGDNVVVTTTSDTVLHGTEIFSQMYGGELGTHLWKQYLGSGGAENDSAVGCVFRGPSVWVAGTAWQNGLTAVVGCRYDSSTGAVLSSWPRFFAP